MDDEGNPVALVNASRAPFTLIVAADNAGEVTEVIAPVTMSTMLKVDAMAVSVGIARMVVVNLSGIDTRVLVAGPEVPAVTRYAYLSHKSRSSASGRIVNPSFLGRSKPNDNWA